MIDRSYRAALLFLVTVSTVGCAGDGPIRDTDPPLTGRAITQNAPAPDYTVFYWNALRACLQTGRSEWECKSGEDRFVRDALAVEAELEARRRLRRQAAQERATFRADAAADAVPSMEQVAAPPRSVVFERPRQAELPDDTPAARLPDPLARDVTQ